MIIEDECYLCNVSYPYYALFRCIVCRRMFCRNCFIYDEEGKITCLRCAKRRISPGGPRSKYIDLSIYFVRRAKYSRLVTLSFSRIEEIIGDQLPTSARQSEDWWANTLNKASSEAWLTVGWRVQNVDLERKEVTFRREKQLEFRSRTRQRRKPVSAAFKAMALRRRSRKSLAPSKTKIARIQARLKNIERKETSIKTLKGKLKPKRAYEKRLYKLDAKP